MNQAGHRRSNFDAESVSYGMIGITLKPDMLRYTPKGFWASEEQARLGTGRDRFELAREQLWQWQVHLNAGLVVQDVVPGDQDGYRGITDVESSHDENEELFTEQGFSWVAPGARITQQTVVLGVPIALPNRVVSVINEQDRAGYVLGTLPGSPLTGEQAFLLDYRADESVWFTVRQLAQVANQKLKLLTPLLRWHQRLLTARFLKALHPTAVATAIDPSSGA